MTRASTARRQRLHPAAWWAWAGGMAAAAMQTTNPELLVLLGAVVVFVASSRRDDAEWSRSLVVFLRLGLFVIVVRVALEVLFGDRIAGHVLFTLPQVPLPGWAAGVSIGGPVTAESLLQAACQGLRLAVVLVAFGAANTLANPYRLLRCLPTVLFEAGVAVTVALAYAPEIVITIGNVREARRLRGRPTRGVAGIRGMAVPVLEGALDRSLELAASMDARGYGRRTPTTAGARHRASLATGVGLVLVTVGVFDTLSAAAPWALGLAALAAGVGLLGLGIAWSGRRARRTRYRPDVWRLAEWLVLASGAVAVAAMATAAALHEAALQPTFSPLQLPALPPLALLAACVGLVPAVVAPRQDEPATAVALAATDDVVPAGLS